MPSNSPIKSLPELENKILSFWQKNDIFAKVIEARKGGSPFVFYDGPPFATGLPHYGHILQMANKDAILRYKTMRGFRVPRKIGWDTHGLPVEYELEKELGISGKRQIEEYGIEKFVQAARSIVLRYTKEWESTMRRMGRWMDLTQPYATMDNDYIESVWWAISELNKKGLIYKDYRVSPYCPRCGTVLSNFEVNQGYKDDVSDPSIYVTMMLDIKTQTGGLDYSGANLIVWTTTPWTLPANTALAVDPTADYVLVDWEENKYILAKNRVNDVLRGGMKAPSIERELKGSELVGLEYRPLYKLTNDENAYHIVASDHVTIFDGSGIVHIAPAYGEDDFRIGKKEGLPLIQTVSSDGTIKSGLVEQSNIQTDVVFNLNKPVGKNIEIKESDRKDRTLPGEGKFVKQADKDIIADLKDRNLLLYEEQIKHTYPFCWRCNTPLLYYPATSWFVKVTALKEEIVRENKSIAWQPAHLRAGRFGRWLEGARDWAISRDRFWGAPLPIWECVDCDHYVVIGSKQELDEKMTGQKGSVDLNDYHRPYIDNISLHHDDCRGGGEGTMKRVPFVLDCWFESGSMPFAQHHYPFEGKNKFEPETKKGYPADFIAEALDQTRGWFYTLHVLGVALFGQHAFESVVVTGLLLAPDGKKLSKSLRNYTAPDELFETIGVDPLRLFLFTATTLGEDYRFSNEAVQDVNRRWLTPLLNVLKYYQLSLVDRDDSISRQPHHTVLDQWIKARLTDAWTEVEKAMNGESEQSPFDLVRACRTFGPLIEDLSTWYVRLSRGRRDAEFTTTLREVLRKICELYAPFIPFITEAIYQELRIEHEVESIHLGLVQAPDSPTSSTLLSLMAHVRQIVSAGRELRAKAAIPNRQPLSSLEVKIKKGEELSAELTALIKDELQVEEVVMVETFSEGYIASEIVALDTTLSSGLKIRGQANLLRRTIQDLRKQTDLTPSDRATALIIGDINPEVVQVALVQMPNTQLEQTTVIPENTDNTTKVTIDDRTIKIALSKI